MAAPDHLRVTLAGEDHGRTYHRVLTLDLSDRPAILGQREGSISFGFNILEQDARPVLFDDTTPPFVFDFMARRINVQSARLKKRNPDALMCIDQPGLQLLFPPWQATGV